MFQYEMTKDNKAVLIKKTQGRGRDIDTRVVLENEVTTDEFIEQMCNIENGPFGIINIDPNDIKDLLKGKLFAWFGHFTFCRFEKHFLTTDDMSWLTRRKVKGACFFVKGDLTIAETCSLMDLIHTEVGDTTNTFFSLSPAEQPDISVYALVTE